MSTNQMSSIRRITTRVWLTIGTILLGVGIAAIAVSSLASALPGSIIIVAFAGIIGFLLGLWLFRNRYRGGISATLVPDVELPISTPAPGDDIDQSLYRLTTFREGTIEYRDRIQERLAEAAIAVIRQRENCTRETALTQLEEGTWTDNDAAAAFFTGGSPPSRSFVNRYRSDDTPYEHWVKTTVNAIAQRAELYETADTGADVDEEEESLFTKLGLGVASEGIRGGSTTGYRDPEEYENTERVSENVTYNPLIQTGEWRGAAAFALLTAGWGVITFQPAILLVSVIPIGYEAFSRAMSGPPLANLEVERHISDTNPDPGERVDVTVTVHNTGSSFLPDLRLVDRVPESSRVVGGSPRLATSLGSDSKATFTYTMIAERGTHEWPLLAIGRDLSGAVERESAIEVEEGIECVPSLRTTSEMPVRAQMSLYSGQVDTSTGGSGLEFFSMREYRAGDPMNRIDWSRYAQSGDLTTIQFREEKAAKVVLLFDARDSAYVSPGPNQRHAVDQAVDAAAEIFGSLNDRGDLVGLAAFDTIPCWLGPSAGDKHEEEARLIFADHPSLSSLPPDLKEVEGQYIDPMTHIRRQLSPEMQIMLFSPLCDQYTAEVARRLDSAGHLVTIISPDPTADRTVGQRLARIERTMRVASLRERGIRVLDWDYDDLLKLEIERAQQRWAV